LDHIVLDSSIKIATSSVKYIQTINKEGKYEKYLEKRRQQMKNYRAKEKSKI